MTAVVNEPRDANLATILGESVAEPKWLRWVDRVATRAGDSVNPILIKETRQALKSRQFVVTFSLLLLAALGWSIAGSLLLMPQIYFLPSGPTLLTGYYLVLAVPMLLVVPLAAYRSLEGEIDDGTLELLSVTALSPKQIVLGKLGSASLQMMLYFVALFPCVAYAYTLRGVDLPTLAILMGLLVVFGLTQTIVAIFFAPMARARSSQVSTLLVVMLLLLGGEFGAGSIAINLINYGNPLSAHQTLYFVVAVILFAVSLAMVLLMATAAQLTPESENRSTSIRVTLMIHEAIVIGIAAYSLAFDFDLAMATVWFLTAHLIVTWIVCGAMMAAESPTMTPRIRRELPATFLGRLFLIWFTPGPATGLIFAMANLVIVLLVMNDIFSRVLLMDGAGYRFGIDPRTIRTAVMLLVSYYCIAMIGVRAIVAILRRSNPVRVGVGLAALAVVLLLMTLAPYSVGLHMNDYRSYPYSLWQITNWVWTLGVALDGALPLEALASVLILGVLSFVGHLLLIGRTVLPQRLMTPQRVIEERRRLQKTVVTDADPSDPLGLGTGTDGV
ncbi:MAG: ABC transporter permease [Planctomycetaceae bacterium]